jgi:cell wall-associated NlpC family hydrolase
MAGDTRRMVFEFIALDRVSKTMKGIGDGAGKMGSKFAAVGASVKAGVAGAAVGGIALLGKMMVQGVKDAASYQTLLNKTAAVIKSTGGSANVSVKHVKNLAASLESLSGVDEELIINSQNVLMTFTQIRNTKTQDTFDQATKAALNMSSALGTDLKNSTILVGKALNDPIKGLTSLRRVGVSFTKSQQDMIKKLEEGGHHEKAQALILKELNKEFGGAAKAAGKGFAGSMARAKDAVSDAFRAVGQKLLPVLTKLADWFASKGWPQMVKFAQTMKTRLEPTFKTVSTWASQHLVPALKALGQWIATKLLPVLQKFAGQYLKGVVSAFKSVASAIKDNKAHFQGFFTVVGKVAAFILKILGPVLGWIVKNGFTLLGKVLGTEIRIIGTVIGWFGKLGDGIKKAGSIVGSIIKKMVSAWNSFRDKIKIGALTILKVFLDMASKLVTGAAKAFGWVPGVGGKLKKAAQSVADFRSKVNAEIGRIKAKKNVNVDVFANGSFKHVSTAGLAKGGKVPALWAGATEAKDSQPALLRVNEHVWTPEETKAAGGHKAVERLRKAALRGELKGYDTGGAVFASHVPSGSKTHALMDKVNRYHVDTTHRYRAAAEEARLLAMAWKKYAASGGSVVAAARSQIGRPYSWGGGGKYGPSYGIGRGAHTYGFDCSGLTQFAWWQGRKIDIGGTTYSQHPNSHRTSKRPGALGFPHLGHVMLASDKPGYVIQAPFTGSHVQEVKRSTSDWRWPNGAGYYFGGPVGQLGARALSAPASLELRRYARMLGIMGDPQKRRAAGGPTRAGMSYLVGEYGTEIHTPRYSGTVHPAGSSLIQVNGPLVQIDGHVMGDMDPVKLTRMILEAERRAKKRGVNVSRS